MFSKKIKSKKCNSGFTIVELSIVALVIGLITSSVIVGKDLVRQSEIRSAISQIEQYQAAVKTFNIKYNAFPGDMADATKYWPELDDGKGNGCAGYKCHRPNKQVHQCDGTPTIKHTCNGNGDGVINCCGDFGNQITEIFLFWQHLSNAGLIIGGNNGGYNGRAGPIRHDAEIGDNVPKTKLPGGGIAILEYETHEMPGFGDHFPKSSRHDFVLGSDPTEFYDNKAEQEFWQFVEAPLLTSIEALSVDEKLDDGLPGKGTVQTRRRSNHGTNKYECTNSAAGSNPVQDAEDARYNPTPNGIECFLLFRMS
ncbi:MAG: type II secretion system protein [Pseudomonadota bacterium]